MADPNPDRDGRGDGQCGARPEAERGRGRSERHAPIDPERLQIYPPLRCLLIRSIAFGRVSLESLALSRPVSQPRPSKRRQVRERVLQALYAFEASGDSVDHVLATVIRPAFEDDRTYLRFAERLFLKSADARHECDVLIDKHVENWDLSRIARTDRFVLWIAITEFLYFEDIPPKVTLNEALEVARAFGTDKSASFVNGVLDAVLRELRQSDRLKKSGRGLVDSTNRGGGA